MAELRIERLFAASVERVFDYVTRPDLLMRWWGPVGTRIGENDLDLSRKGPWFFTLIREDGGGGRVTGEVLAVQRPDFVEFTLIVPGPEDSIMIDSLVRFEVSADKSGGTRFVLIQTGLSSEQVAEMSTKGWVSTLARLEAEFATTPSKT